MEDNESTRQSYDPDIDILTALASGDEALLGSLEKQDAIFRNMVEDMLDKGSHPEQSEELTPFSKLRILISVDIDHAVDVREAIEKIATLDGVQVEYGAN